MSRKVPGIVRLLLRLFPEDFRKLHEKGIASDYPGPTGSGKAAQVWYWFRASADLLAALWGVWWDRLSIRPSARSDRVSASRAAGVLADARYAFRGLRRTPGFTVAAVLTLALGLGANAAIFSVVNGVLLRPPPYENPEELVRAWSRFVPEESGLDFPYFTVDPMEYLDFRDQSRSFASLAAYHPNSFTLSANDSDAEMTNGVVTTWNLFELLGADALLGRTLLPSEDVEGGPDVVVLTADMWRSRFGADAEIVGSTIILNRRPFVVAGVLRDGFSFPDPSVDLYVPLQLGPNPSARTGHYLRVVGRLAEGVSFEMASEEVDRLMSNWAEDLPEFHTGHFLFIEGFQERDLADVRPALLVLLGAVGLLLLVVCANVANLLLVRGQSRTAEAALRRALGAGRWRVVQLGLVESAILAALGAALGLVLTRLGLQALLALDDGALPTGAEVSIDRRVLGFTALVAVATALVSGVAPVLQTLRSDAVSRLRTGGRGGSGTRRSMQGRNLLIASEVALSFVLVVGAGLMAKTFATLVRDDPGFDSSQALVADYNLPATAYSDVGDGLAFLDEVTQAVEALPGVIAVTHVSHLPMGTRHSFSDFELEGVPEPGPEAPSWNGRVSAVGASYFEAMGIDVVEGRGFDQFLDRVDGVPAVVVNRALADRYLGGERALGQRMRGGSGEERPWWTIVGIVEDVQHERLGGDRGPAFYILTHQIPLYNYLLGSVRVGTFVIRSDAPDPLDYAAPLRRIVAQVDSDLALTRVTSLDSLVGESVARSRFTMVLMGLFSMLALLLGGVGIYGVTSFAISQRRREIGIRKAVGAEDTSIAALVIRTGMVPVAAGMGVGVVGALATSGLLAGLLYGVSPVDWPTYTAVFCVLGAAALTALWYPARKAARLDPMTSIRGD